jgi:hypothetical protein
MCRLCSCDRLPRISCEHVPLAAVVVKQARGFPKISRAFMRAARIVPHVDRQLEPHIVVHAW